MGRTLINVSDSILAGKSERGINTKILHTKALLNEMEKA
jgi:hypothetical protein